MPLSQFVRLVAGFESLKLKRCFSTAAAFLALSIPAGVLQSAEVENAFFAMDTAVKNLDQLGHVREFGYAGIGWKTKPDGEFSVDLQRIRESGVKLFACYGGATLTKTELVLNESVESNLALLKGSDTILWLPIFSKDFAVSDPEGDRIAVAALTRLAELAASFELRIALYPHKGAWLERIQDAVRLADKIDRGNLGVTFNLCHALMVGDEAEIPGLLKEAAPRLFLVTINGADTGAAGTEWARLIRPLGEGTFDLRPVLKTLKSLDYRGPIGLQAYGIPLPPEENLRRSMASWKRMQLPHP
jgi:sugar phosphate isomerase/epimerase